ncbi:uncharacterized protein TRAVEDRAFT_71599 [Trametes versicolor FP-101664 SS1]|uniref:uncharacterized protein n=1 Tax=Trametes versicolor (strain FP-101664) TaxID=717944 RepID=UPI0004623728|nr:uncharacterized protein TRAVEDRAFT_71599 [Trametes versicolor FP-101664 SS1]EIW59584.1 hypothetical protein TRAVEDRAFT_71599 [Trametes versicolor FP-101664 SS1]
MSSTNSATTTTEAIATTHELTETFGVLLIGFIFTVTLYGLTFFQTYIYYTRFPHDERGIKYTVGLLWYGLRLLTFISEEALSVFLALVVQCFYAFRIWTVSGKRSMIPAVIVTLALAAFAFNLASVAKMTDQMLFYQVVSKSLTKAICWGLSVGANILIATSMLWYLRPSTNPGMATPDGWYEQIVVYGVNRGTSFAIVQTVSLITIVTMPNQQIWILFHWVGSKVYINSILSRLNFRNTHRGRGVPEESSLNAHAHDSDGRSGTITTRSGGSAGQLDTSLSVHFNVPTESKGGGEALGMGIELDLVDAARGDAEGASYGDVDIGEKEKAESASVAAFGGPSKPRDIEEE